MVMGAHSGWTIVVAALVMAGQLWQPPAARALGSCGTGGSPGSTSLVQFEGSLYYVTTPAILDPNQELPLIIGLHGDEGDPAASVNNSWRAVPDGRFIFVAPKAPTASGSWYEPNEIAQTQEWFDSMLRQLLGQYNIDLDRIYAWGLSGGAEFLAYHGLGRLQNVLAGIQYNMGGNYWGWFLGGQPRRTGICKIPARFSTFDGLADQCAGYSSGDPPPLPGMGSPTEGDFLCPTSKALYDTLTMLGHETDWTDWGNVPCLESRGHCWNPVQNEGAARDWFLSHSLCGTRRPAGCGEAYWDSPLADPPWLSGAPTTSDPTTVTPAVDPSAPVPGSPTTSSQVEGAAGVSAPLLTDTTPGVGTTSSPLGQPVPKDARARRHSGCSVGNHHGGASNAWAALIPMALLRRRRQNRS